MRYGRHAAIATTRKFLTAASIVIVGTGALPSAQRVATADPPRQRINPMIEKLASGGIVSRPEDWLNLDYEHRRPYSMDALVAELAEVGAKRKPNGQIMSAPIVRIPLEGHDDSRWIVKQTLDSGAMGIMFPRIETAAQAERAVASMRYPREKNAPFQRPVGVRGWGPTRAAQYWGLTVAEYAARADVWPLNPEGELIAVMQIESAEGVKNAAEIAAVPGVGALATGPSDLRLSMGLGIPRGDMPPALEAAVQTILAACKSHHVPCFTAVYDAADRQKYLDQGFRGVTSMVP